MKNLKIGLWAIFIALLILVFFQNRAFLIEKQALILNLYVIEELQSTPLPIAVWFLTALCIGFLVAYFFFLIEKFKTKRMIAFGPDIADWLRQRTGLRIAVWRKNHENAPRQFGLYARCCCDRSSTNRNLRGQRPVCIK